ncbi:MAG: aminopeptidase P family protein [Planctomycetes bacterium]|nr:aminopeptidase P family protein [Planctomycetota bacterium]
MASSTTRPTAVLMAGAPSVNSAVYHKIRFLVGDPTAVVDLAWPDGRRERIVILRDIEMDRARRSARADRIACPADFAPASGLSGDRETATAQAAAECLIRGGVADVTCDRSLPQIYAHFVQAAGIGLTCDLDLGVLERRSKDEQESEWLRAAQRMTEGAMRMACGTIARAQPRHDGVLVHEGAPLTSDRIRAMIDVWLMERRYQNPTSIVAGGPQGADCHDYGSGELRTDEPILIDIFPRCRETRYYGDCTRTVVHGTPSDDVRRMHAAVVRAKAAATAATRPGATGEQVHAATSASIRESGYAMGLPPERADARYCGMTHGTGHGVGLEVHEPPLLDRGGPPLVAGDCLTIEPGLYCRAIGGVRVEDMVLVTRDGCENLNTLHEGLDWR